MPENTFTETTLDAAETAFQAALLAGDADTLDATLHDRVRFTGPDGSTVDKAADMATHRSGAIRLTTVEESTRDVQVIEGVGVTRALLHLVGTIAGDPVDLTLAYTRTWIPSPTGWVVIAAHGSPAVGPART